MQRNVTTLQTGIANLQKENDELRKKLQECEIVLRQNNQEN